MRLEIVNIKRDVLGGLSEFEIQFDIYQLQTIQLDQLFEFFSICLAIVIHSLFVIK